MSSGQQQQQPPPRRVTNVGSLLLTPQENESLFTFLGKKCVTMSSAVVQLYAADRNCMWSKKCSGVACLVKDNPQRSYFLRIFDIKTNVHSPFRELQKCILVWMGNYCGNKSYTITLYIIVLEDIFIPLLEILVKLPLILPMKKKQKNSEKQLQTWWAGDKGNLFHVCVLTNLRRLLSGCRDNIILDIGD